MPLQRRFGSIPDGRPPLGPLQRKQPIVGPEPPIRRSDNTRADFLMTQPLLQSDCLVITEDQVRRAREV